MNISIGGITFSSNDSSLLLRGRLPGFRLIPRKFGRNSNVTTTLTPVCSAGVYRTPTAGVTLAVISDDANDNPAGTGCRSVRVSYIRSTDYTEQTADIATNGTSEGGTIPNVLRTMRLRTLTSGVYADQSTPSHASTITLQESGGGAVWADIGEDSGFGYGQSLIGAYTSAANKYHVVYNATKSVDSGKTTTLMFFERQNIDIVTPPCDTLRVNDLEVGLSGFIPGGPQLGGLIPPLTDYGFMASVASTAADVSVSFSILEIDGAYI